MQNQNQNQNQNQSQNRAQNQNPNRTQNQNRSQNQNPQVDFSLRETSPNLTANRPSFSNDRVATTFDLVESMDYLYIRVVKAKELPPKDSDSSTCDPLVEVKIGAFKALTKHLERNANPEYNQVFSILKDRIQAPNVIITVKDKSHNGDDLLGKIVFEIVDIPKRIPPDSPLAPQWYRLEDKNGRRVRGELMLAVWMGNQADEAFPDAFHLDNSSVSSDHVANLRSKVYLSPKLWYLRVNVIEAQDLQVANANRPPEVLVKAIFGNMVLKTKISQSRNRNPMWNEDLMFVAAEPFDDEVALSVEDRIGPNKEELLGKCTISLQGVEKRSDSRGVSSKWYNLEKTVAENQVRAVGKIHMRVSLDGGYHVLDELTQYCSDFRATEKTLNKNSVGVLELGILSAQGLVGMKKKDNRETTDAYCVAKYGPKWVRTRTILDSFSPEWNEQYTWEVFDPCTVVTVVVFDNGHLNGGGEKDLRIGKIRIRLSTLENGRVYTHSYPLIILQPSGVKKLGEIQLAVRFTISSLTNVLQLYSTPLLPKMHYLYPLTIFQQDSLRHQSTQIIATRMSRAEPPLRKEVVEYMLDVGSHMWSLRKSKANICRISRIFSGLILISKWFDDVCAWKSTFLTVFIHILCLMMVIEPRLVFITLLIYPLIIGVLNYRKRIRHPPYMDARLSLADVASLDDLDEEFDTFPSSKQGDILKARYDRMRCIGARIQAVIGDLATQGERLHALLTWRDKTATAIFMIFCLFGAILMFFTPIWLICDVAILYVLRHPRFRYKMPSSPFNFFRRLPTKADSLL